jgi:hypothetical protein
MRLRVRLEPAPDAAEEAADGARPAAGAKPAPLPEHVIVVEPTVADRIAQVGAVPPTTVTPIEGPPQHG